MNTSSLEQHPWFSRSDILESWPGAACAFPAGSTSQQPGLFCTCTLQHNLLEGHSTDAPLLPVDSINSRLCSFQELDQLFLEAQLVEVAVHVACK